VRATTEKGRKGDRITDDKLEKKRDISASNFDKGKSGGQKESV